MMPLPLTFFDGSVKSRKTPSPLKGEGRGEGEKTHLKPGLKYS